MFYVPSWILSQSVFVYNCICDAREDYAGVCVCVCTGGCACPGVCVLHSISVCATKFIASSISEKDVAMNLTFLKSQVLKTCAVTSALVVSTADRLPTVSCLSRIKANVTVKLLAVVFFHLIPIMWMCVTSLFYLSLSLSAEGRSTFFLFF